MAFIRSGALRPIAVYGATRAQQLPDVPTVAESGVPELMVDSWLGLSAPARTPRAVLAKLGEATRWACAQEDFKAQMREYGAESFFSTGAELDERIRKDKTVWAGIFKTLGIQPT
jgi:tripartite-type tricarboxylate transporter receptor subunit TctC